MNKLVYTALCVASVLALPGCFGSKEEQKPAEVQTVTTEAAKPAEQAPEAAQAPAEQAAQPAAEQVPAK